MVLKWTVLGANMVEKRIHSENAGRKFSVSNFKISCEYVCVGVLVIYVLVFTVFCFVCTVFLYCFFYVYLVLYVLSGLV
jgi:hypothetical protein